MATGNVTNLLGVLLPHHVLVQVIVDLLGRRGRLPVLARLLVHADLLLAVHLAQHNEEVVALLALHEPGGTHEGLHVGAGVAALRARQRVLVLAAPAARVLGRGRRGGLAAGGRVAGSDGLQEDDAGRDPFVRLVLGGVDG